MPAKKAVAKKNNKMPSLVLLHGYAESSNKVWFPWLHRKAEDAGWRVWAPNLPNPLKPEFRSWMKAVSAQAKTWDRQTVIVGHSLGGVLALRALAESGQKVRAVVTVSAPFAATVSVGQLIRFFDTDIDWPVLRRQARNFVTIHSKDDPLVAYDHARRYQEALNSRLVFVSKSNHFIGKRAKPVWDELQRLA